MKTSIVTVHEAKTNLSHLLKRASQDEEVVIARGAKPVARFADWRDSGAAQARFIEGQTSGRSRVFRAFA